MVRGSYNLAVDLMALDKTMDAVGVDKPLRRVVLDFIGRREPVELDFGHYTKCWQCCKIKDSWWRQNVISRKQIAVDELRKEVYSVEEIEFSDLDDDYGRKRRGDFSFSDNDDDDSLDLDDDDDDDILIRIAAAARASEARDRAAFEAFCFPLDDPEMSYRKWGLHFIKTRDEELVIEDLDEVLAHITCFDGKIYACAGCEPHPVFVEYSPQTKTWRTLGAGPQIVSDFDVIRNYEGKLQYVFATDDDSTVFIVDEDGDIKGRYVSGEPVRMVRFITPVTICVMDCCMGIEIVLMRLDTIREALAAPPVEPDQNRDETYFLKKFNQQRRVLEEREEAREKEVIENAQSTSRDDDDVEGKELFCLRYGPLESYEYRVSPCGHVIACDGSRGDISVVYQ
ncbi:hypothetical protein FOL47_006447 [Perkinsus chesapeaki]|uniref:Uncharacterized protein n=1 Tax=Perkinsus chesapeaki TaxID=330153 RepID=A0A7J6MZL2_PERCH|nr:hypothetical protein FOL47_006447 [Perkinsus chesapeaki]